MRPLPNPGRLPTRRLLLLLAAAAPLFLLSGTLGVAADVLLLLAAAADALLAPGAEALSVERHAPASLPLDAEAEVSVAVRNRTGRALHLRLTDDLPAALERRGAEEFSLVAAPRGQVGVRYPVHARARGHHALGDVHLRVRGPMGLVWRELTLARAEPLQVLPGVLEVRRYRGFGLHHRAAEAGLHRAREHGESGAFESLREYVRGDDPRRVDWKATARRGSLTVRQFEAERGQNLLLAIDAGRLMAQKIGERERLDHALSAALLLADAARRYDDRVGLLVFAERVEQFIPPSRVSLPRLADALAGVQARLQEPNYPAAFTYLTRQLRRRSLLVLFTDFGDAHVSSALVSHLGQAARRHLALAVALRNPALEEAADAEAGSEAGVYRRVAAEELLQARANTLFALQRAGVRVSDTRPQDAVPTVLDRYLEIKRRGLL